MHSPLPLRRFPTAYVSDQQIAYVTDNDRDAEALSCEMECPVVSDRRNQRFHPPYSTIIIRQTSQTPGTSRRSDVRNVPNVSSVPGVSDILSVSPLTNSSDVSDALGVSGTQTSPL